MSITESTTCLHIQRSCQTVAKLRANYSEFKLHTKEYPLRAHPCDSEVIRNGRKRSLCLYVLMICTYSSGSDVATLIKHGDFYSLLTYSVHYLLHRLQSANVHVATAVVSGSLVTLCHSRSNFCPQFFTVPGRIINPHQGANYYVLCDVTTQKTGQM